MQLLLIKEQLVPANVPAWALSQQQTCSGTTRAWRNGRRARLRIWFRKDWRFKSSRAHHVFKPGSGIRDGGWPPVDCNRGPMSFWSQKVLSLMLHFNCSFSIAGKEGILVTSLARIST